MKKLIAFFLMIALLAAFTGCAAPEQKVYEASFLTLFDTVTTIKGTAESKEAFSETAQKIHDELFRYHQLFDIYKEYDGINNLKTVNSNAGKAPVKVDPSIVDLLTDCKTYYDLTGGKVNAAMGSVLALWHEARTDNTENARLPDTDALCDAAKHTNFDSIVIDAAASTVFISDPETRLDVGAIAKGWAAQRVAENAPAGLLISIGGNICATGPKTENAPWVVGVRDPQGSASDYIHTLNVTKNNIVTSGDYQRSYTVGGKRYHHIIDPATLMPSEYWRSVTVICPDSGLADALSTALFLMPQAEGQALLTKCGAEAMWIDGSGNCFYSPGFRNYIRS